MNLLKENQNKLKEKIVKILKEIGHMQDIKSAIGKEYLGRNLAIHRVMSVWMNPDYLYTLTDSDEDIKFLFLFAVSLQRAMKNKVDINLDIENYFTKLEYQQWINYKEDKKEDSIFPIVFENTQQITDKIWQTTLTAQQLDTLSTANIILYNFSTQRSPKITVSGISIDYDKQKTIEIKDRLLNGEQFPDHIKLNILNNFQERISYNPKTQELIIGEGSIINIFDGFHRKVASSLAVEEAVNKNIEFNFIWPIIITNLSENDAKDYMVQIDKQKPIKKEQIKSWDLKRKENLVVSVIADDRISKLSKVMKDQYSEIKLQKGLVTKNIIAEAIAENYKLDDTTDIRGLGKWIVEFTDYLFSLYPKEFITNPYSVQEYSVINNQNLFYGYISMSASFQEDNWKEKVKNKMEAIDFNIDNPIWKEIGIFQYKINKSTRNKIYKLFENKGVG
jgi:hypothetical protein